jgi:hypothetical protein
MVPERSGGCSLRTAILPQVRFERPHNLNSHHRVGTEEHASRSATSSGAARGDYEAKGAVQMALDEFDCGLEEHPPEHSGSAQLGNGFMTQNE